MLFHLIWNQFFSFQHLSDTDNSFMCIWDEYIIVRGGNEIAYDLLKVFFKKNLVMWSDNHIGQNKDLPILPKNKKENTF